MPICRDQLVLPPFEAATIVLGYLWETYMNPLTACTTIVFCLSAFVLLGHKIPAIENLGVTKVRTQWTVLCFDLRTLVPHITNIFFLNRIRRIYRQPWCSSTIVFLLDVRI